MRIGAFLGHNAAMRIDRHLVEHGHFESRAQAQAALRAGHVRVDGHVVRKASTPVPDGATVTAEAPHPWVGRGGVKLDHALSEFGLDVSGMRALDVGASTGGFTDVLLARGVSRVYAVDVGRDQLHPRLRGDPRVVVMEGQDARELSSEMMDNTPVDIVVVDASFIPLAKVLPVPLSLARTGADLVALVKPQFEVGKAGVGRGGVVRDDALRERAVSDAAAWLADQDWEVRAVTESPITGGARRAGGNRESLIWAQRALMPSRGKDGADTGTIPG